MPNKILLLDSNSLMHRAYHALPNLKTSTGQYTGAIFGFLNILLRLIKEQRPTHIAAAFDLKGPTFRHEMYSLYKVNRKPMDEELRCQVEPLKSLIVDMGIRIVSLERYEGDDILGTLARRFSNDECIIVTGDRDSFQLVAPNTKIFWTKKGVSEIEVYDEAKLKEEGFTAQSYIDYKALRGDPSDNIPGVTGVGEKTAKQLIDDYGSLDAVLANASSIKGKLGENLSKSRDIALLSRELSVIKTDVPVECTLDDIKFTPVYSNVVKAKLAELEINSLAARMDFEQSAAEPLNVEKRVIELTRVEEIAKAATGDRIAIFIGEKVLFATSPDVEYEVVCSQDLFGEGINFDDAVAALVDASKDKELVAYDVKTMSKTYGFQCDKVFDVMIAAHLARESAPIKSIEQVLCTDGYSVGAAELLLEREALKKQLESKGLSDLYYNVELPLLKVLRNMETRGVRVSADALKELEKKYALKISELEERIYAYAGLRFNIASSKQLGEVLFEKMQLGEGKKKRTKIGYSVSEEVLTNMMGEHPIIADILEYRHYSKLQSTYVVGLQPLITRGRIHTEYNQCITMTGRLSSTNPNLQNLPTRSEEAKDIKSAFLPSEGNVLVSADYSQIELRLLAHMSGDDQLVYAFNHDEDIHAMTASQILGVPIEEVTPAQRRDAKAVNFGIIYGISGFGLAENLSIPQYKARNFIDNYYKMHPKVRAFMDACVSEARERGYALTLLGRRRNLSDLRSANFNVRSAAERMAMNTPLQGSAADIIKLAMLGVERRLEKMKSEMILQIHDELIIDAAVDELKEVENILTEEMQNAYKLNIPLVAEAKYADNWGMLK